jgi:hypothetical protein
MIHRIFIVSFLFFVASCGSEKKEQQSPTEANNYTLIFIDKTESVHIENQFVNDKFKAALKTIIEENINKAGDRLDVYFVHENTSKARALSLVARTTKDPTDGMNATDLEAAQTNYDLMIRRERTIFTQQATKQLLNANTTASNRETNITASVPVIAKAAETGFDVRVYYFSDMIESLKQGRDFHKNAPTSAEQANEWAKTDAEKMQNYVIGNPMITMILPFEATSSTNENNPNVTAYWQALFQNLGATAVTEL